MHFSPTGWSLHVGDLRSAIHAELLGIVHIVDTEPGDFIWYDESVRDACRSELRVALAIMAPTDE